MLLQGTVQSQNSNLKRIFYNRLYYLSNDLSQAILNLKSQKFVLTLRGVLSNNEANLKPPILLVYKKLTNIKTQISKVCIYITNYINKHKHIIFFTHT